ncbi:MAG: CRISPR-associated endonuclease Cas1 [Firmicutes bacterium ADurb.Bin419]|nr:MAG: CRISPR-associated endonuclease Cas1 [Firmicutes bacterium ADurb.Bin419]
MGILYLTSEGSKVRKNGGRITVFLGTESIKEIPLEQVDAVVVFSGVHLTEELMVEFLRRGTAVTFLSSRGQYYGRLEPVQSVDVVRQMKQARLTNNEEFCVGISKQFISSKIHNQITVLRWFFKNRPDLDGSEMDRLKVLQNKIKEAGSINEVIGYEGSAAKIYFSCISKLCNPEFGFSERTRQPPKDAFNSMLSYGYTLLMYEIYTLIGKHGLYPYFGFMHRAKRGHPALASDLMEEWRPIIVDSFVLHLANKGSFKSVDFETDSSSGGVFLCKEQSKEFLKRYEKRVITQIKNEENPEEVFNYRLQLDKQVTMLAKAIDEADYNVYKSYRIR